MNPSIEEDDERDTVHRRSDREINLGTTMILLIFFGLAVYGAALFGFGYAMGNKHPAAAAAVVAAAIPATSTVPTAKPSPGSPLSSAAKARAAEVAAGTGASTPSVIVPMETEASSGSDSSVPHTASRPPGASAASVTVRPPPAAGVVQMVVQIAAVSHREDADLIASTLQRRGYAVNINSEPDNLLHVQVGPFSSRKDAEAMRARLLGDGFNGYIK